MKHIMHGVWTILAITFLLISCSKDDDFSPKQQTEIHDNDSLGQPENIIVSLVSEGLQGIIDIDLSPSITLEIKRSIDAEETIALFSRLTEEEIRTELMEEESTDEFLSDEYWEITENPVVFSKGEIAHCVTISLSVPPRMKDEQIFAFGVRLKSFTQQANIESSKSKVVFRVKVSAMSGTEQNPYILNTSDDLLAMKSKIDAISSKDDIYFSLQSDIDMSGIEWVPLIDAGGSLVSKGYKVIHFEGNNHVISNLVCKEKPYASFFGILVGQCNNVTFKDAIIVGNKSSSTGIVAGSIGNSGYVGQTKVTNVHVCGSVDGGENIAWEQTYHAYAAGGICGIAAYGSQISICSSNASVKGTTAGGIVGDLQSEAFISESFCKNAVVDAVGEEPIAANSAPAGGIVGRLTKGTIRNCYSVDVIIASHTSGTGVYAVAGGVAGILQYGVTIENCYSARCTISASQGAGGIAGRFNEGAISLLACMADNTSISSTGTFESGLISGWVDGTATITPCYAGRNTIFHAKDLEVIGDEDNDYVIRNLESDRGSYRFHGDPLTLNMSETAKNKLAWDVDIWSFDEECPKLKYNKEY